MSARYKFGVSCRAAALCRSRDNIGSYVRPGVATNFYTVTESARRRGSIALGYRRVGPPGRRDEMVLNPDKSAVVTFGPADQVIVLSSRSAVDRAQDPERSAASTP